MTYIWTRVPGYLAPPTPTPRSLRSLPSGPYAPALRGGSRVRAAAHLPPSCWPRVGPPSPEPPSGSGTFRRPPVVSAPPSPRNPGNAARLHSPAAARWAPLTRGLCLRRRARGGPGRSASSPWARAGGGSPSALVRRGEAAGPKPGVASEAGRAPSDGLLGPELGSEARPGPASFLGGGRAAPQRGLPGRPGGAGKSRPPPTSLVRHRGSRAGAPRPLPRAPRLPCPARGPRHAPRALRPPNCHPAQPASSARLSAPLAPRSACAPDPAFHPRTLRPPVWLPAPLALCPGPATPPSSPASSPPGTPPAARAAQAGGGRWGTGARGFRDQSLPQLQLYLRVRFCDSPGWARQLTRSTWACVKSPHPSPAAATPVRTGTYVGGTGRPGFVTASTRAAGPRRAAPE